MIDIISSYTCSSFDPFNNWLNIRLNKPTGCVRCKSCEIIKMSNNHNICVKGIINLDWIDFIKFNSKFECNPLFKEIK